jgi:hypothetical protein
LVFGGFDLKGSGNSKKRKKDHTIEEEEDINEEDPFEDSEDPDEDIEEEDEFDDSEDPDEDIEEDDEFEDSEDPDEDIEEDDEFDDSEDPDEEDIEEDDRPLKVKRTDKKKILLPVAIVSILIIASIATIIVLNISEKDDDNNKNGTDIDPFDNLGSDDASQNQLGALISEIDPANEWLEIYITDPGSTDGWKFTTFDEGMVTIPDISGLIGNVQILIHTGSGTNDLDGSDGRATVYLGLQGDVLEDKGDEVALFDSGEKIIDFMAWGGGNGDTEREGWDNSHYPQAPPPGSSLSLQGRDLGKDSFWTIGPSSPLSFNIFEVDMSPLDDFNARIVNGRNHPVIFEGPEDGKYVTVNVTTGVPPGNPVNRTLLEEVAEYVNFTYNLLKEHGFGDALASGKDSKGDPYVNITVTANGTCSGSCKANGDIDVDLGNNKVANKQTVEHEMTHNFQFARRADGTNHINPNEYNFIDEGQAEFWGRYSAMKNYNLTWSQVEEELKKAGTFSAYDYHKTPWYDIFTDWPGVYNRNYTVSYGHYYTGSYLFMKFLMDKFNISMLSKLHNTVRNGPDDSKDVLGIKAVEKATGRSFEELLIEYNLYLLENRFPQYQNDTKFKTTKMAKNHTFTGSDITDIEYLEQYGSEVNRYNVNGSLCLIRFNPRTAGSRWHLTVVKVGRNGSREYEELKLEKGKNGTILILGEYDHVLVIKTRLNGSDQFKEYFNITMSEMTFVIPKLPELGYHEIEDPGDDTFFVWEVQNWIEGMTLRFQLDNSSGFESPMLDRLIDDLEKLSLPTDLPDGTWWWRLRWELDDVLGPWTSFRNFTLWRDWKMPMIMWDPEPNYYLNMTSNYTIILPNSTLWVEEVQVYDNRSIREEDIQIEWRLNGWNDTLDNRSLRETFTIGDVINSSVNFVEWRLSILNIKFPWFRFDVLLYPGLPNFRILEPENGSKQSQNTSMKIQVDGLPDGEFIVDTEFIITFSNETVDDLILDLPVIPTVDPGIFEVGLELFDLAEGWISYDIRMIDAYGSESESREVHLNITRNVPMFMFVTDPPGITGHFNRNPTLRIGFFENEIESIEIVLEPETGAILTTTLTEYSPGGPLFEYIWNTTGLDIPEGYVYCRMNIRTVIGNEMAFVWGFTMDWTPPLILFRNHGDGFTHNLEEGLNVAVDVLPPDDWETIDQNTARFVIKDMSQDGLEVYNETMYWTGVYWSASVNVLGYSPGSYRFEAYAWDLAGNCAGDAVVGTFYYP